MLAKLLEHETAEGQRREIAVTKEEFLIGRGADCDLRLRESAISRHHCLLRIRPGEVTISDLGSANGTFVNGQRIRSQATVINGDELGIGECRFVLELHGASGIDWGPAAGSKPEEPTCRVERPRALRKIDEAKKKESHPPGEAGG
jgi:pSer/pThr/pTyr-binding forkhead associated (FHA) protein